MVLVPIALVVLIGFLALANCVRQFVSEQLRLKEQLELFRDVAVALMFIGPGFGLVFGIDERSPQLLAYSVAAAAFVLFGWASVQLSNLLRDLRVEQEDLERKEQARKAHLLRRQGIVGKKRKNRLKLNR